jgi:hypothetical protein
MNTKARFKTVFILSLSMVLLILTVGQSYSNPARASKFNPQKAARIDVCFLIDSTGSMSDEIDVVKQKIWDIANQIMLGNPRPDVRFAIVTYRDHGDVYLTKLYPLTRNIDEVYSNLMQIVADGGGDKREDVNEAFRRSVYELNWDRSAGVARMIFLIGDAGPHMDYQQTVCYLDTARNAAKRGIQVYSIGCSGIDSSEIYEFTDMARITGGTFEYLTYKMDVYQEGMKKTLMITGDDASITESGSLSDSEWRKGAGEMKSAGKARIALKEEKVVVYDESSGEEREVSAGEMGGSYNTQFMENNLDTVIRRQIQVQAEMQGARYDNPELKVKITETTSKKPGTTKKVKKVWVVEFFEAFLEFMSM